MWRYTFRLIEDDRPPLVVEAHCLQAAVESYQIPYPHNALLMGIERAVKERVT